jgi:multidrug efflux system membrane fusion protein
MKAMRLVSVALGAALFCGCQGARARDPGGRRAVPVSVQAAVSADVPIEVATNGNVLPISTIAIKSRVDGQIERVSFHEGDDVKAGSPLFTIDPRPFRLALQQAEATLARDEVLAKNAELEAQRASGLLEQKLVSQQEFDQRSTQLASLRVTLQADRGTVETARVNLGYTRIDAPISGRTGSLQITAGNLIKANTDPALIVIRQISPIYVAFSVPADRLPELRRGSEHGPLAVQARAPSDTATVDGKLTFIDNTVDTATGTIALKATFANEDHTLWPGQFVEVKLRFGTLHDAVIVPVRAIVPSQHGDQAFVVGEGLVVEARKVETGPRMGDSVVVRSGIKGGERVVTDGQMNLIPGSKVELNAALDKPEGAPP